MEDNGTTSIHIFSSAPTTIQSGRVFSKKISCQRRGKGAPFRLMGFKRRAVAPSVNNNKRRARTDGDVDVVRAITLRALAPTALADVRPAVDEIHAILADCRDVLLSDPLRARYRAAAGG